jgi:alkanesulfonate monooxygenase SsuD/methylene tetrahydromethanopterin reductase-like flavin-dependent oxidoreductase (luciferase family)
MNAGLSPRGQEFAISHADMIFIAQPDHETTTKTVLDLRERAAKAGRSISIFWEAYVVCADTEKEAKQYRDYYIHEKGDWVGVRNLLDDLIPNSQSVLGSQWESMAENMIGGYAGSPLVGTPEQIVEGLLAMKKTGIDGTTLSWVKYVEGIDQYREQILPLAIEAGLRVA